jgi:diacylglycerol kinase family enzyme
VHCDAVEVQVPDCTRFNVDGELITEGQARFRAVKGAFRLVIG